MTLIMTDLNYVGALMGTVLGYIIGALWYSSVLFGKMWMKEMNLKKKDMAQAKAGMGKSTVLSFLSTLVMAITLAILHALTGTDTFIGYFGVAILVWVGFVATSMLNPVLWENKSVNLYLINIGHYLAVLLAMSLVIGSF